MKLDCDISKMKPTRLACPVCGGTHFEAFVQNVPFPSTPAIVDGKIVRRPTLLGMEYEKCVKCGWLSIPIRQIVKTKKDASFNLNVIRESLLIGLDRMSFGWTDKDSKSLREKYPMRFYNKSKNQEV